MRVLLLEDCARLSGAFARRLRHDGYAVDEVRTLAQAREAACDVDYDCLVLDRHVPDGDSLTLVPVLAAADRPSPVVLVSADGDADARIEGLACGAEDYLAKPVRLDELSLRVGKVVARCRVPGSPRCPTVRLGRVEVDLDRRELTLDQRPVHISRTQYAVLEYLVIHRDRMVSSEELLEHCWDGARDLFSNPLHSQVSRLRKMLRGAVRIRFVQNAGYRLEVEPSP